MSDAQKTYTIDHFYWGKLVVNKIPEGGYRVIATSHAWQQEEANQAHQRVYLGSHNGFAIQHLQLLISIYPEKDLPDSDLLVAFIQRSDHIDRSGYYPEYHVLRVPYPIIEAYQHNYVHLVPALYNLHQRLTFTQLHTDLPALIFILPGQLPDDLDAPRRYVLQRPVMQNDYQRAYLLTSLLNQRPLVFLHDTPLDITTWLTLLTGFTQLIPSLARWRINGAFGVFQSRESRPLLQYPYDAERMKTNPKALRTNVELGISPDEETRTHIYHHLLDTIIKNNVKGFSSLFARLDGLLNESHQVGLHNDHLALASHRLLYSDYWKDDEARAQSLIPLIQETSFGEQKLSDIKALCKLALDTGNSSWLQAIYEDLFLVTDEAVAWFEEYKPKHALVDLLLSAWEDNHSSLAQWLLQPVIHDDYQLRQLVQKNSNCLINLIQYELDEKYTQETVEKIQKLLQRIALSHKEVALNLIQAIVDVTFERTPVPDLNTSWLFTTELDESLRYNFIQKMLLYKPLDTDIAQAFLTLSPPYWQNSSIENVYLILEQSASDITRDNFYIYHVQRFIKETMPDTSQLSSILQRLSEAHQKPLASYALSTLVGYRTWQQYNYQLEQVIAFFDQLNTTYPLEETLDEDNKLQPVQPDLIKSLLDNLAVVQHYLGLFEKKGFFTQKQNNAEVIMAHLTHLINVLNAPLPPEDPLNSP